MAENKYLYTLDAQAFSDLINQTINKALQDNTLKQDRLLTASEAAEYLKCSVEWIWHLRKIRKLKGTGAGKRVYFRESILIEFLKEKEA